MMFAGGNILPQEELPTLLDTLEERLNETRSGQIGRASCRERV